MRRLKVDCKEAARGTGSLGCCFVADVVTPVLCFVCDTDWLEAGSDVWLEGLVAAGVEVPAVGAAAAAGPAMIDVDEPQLIGLDVVR